MNTIKISKALKRQISGTKFTVTHSVSDGEYLIMYISHGRGKVVLNKLPHPVSAGDFILIRSGDTLSYKFSENTDAVVYFAEFTAENFSHLEKDLSLAFGFHHMKNIEKVESTFCDLIDEIIVKSPLWEINSSALLCRLIYLLSADTSEISPTEELLHKLAKDIHENFMHGEIDVKKYADKVNLSKDRFSVIFKKHFGYPPYKYQLMLKMEEATYLLTHTELPIAEISKILGFSNQLYFSSAYKKHTGMTPTKARKL